VSLDTRAAAAAVIGEVLAGRSLDRALPPQLERAEGADRAFLQQLCYGTLREAPRLQAVLNQLLDRPLKTRDRDVQGLLLCGLYQIDGTRVPDHAAVSATVGASAGLGKTWARGLVNAVLRRYLRERETLAAALDEAAASAHPDWLHRELREQWPGQAADILAAGNTRPPMTLRVNLRRQSREDYLALLAERGIAARPGDLVDTAVYLDDAVDVTSLPGFAQGAASVQDESAQLAAQLLRPAAGERVLDACAAPGGKACHLLEQQPQTGELVAMDADARRMLQVAENLERLGLSATLLTGDAAAPPAQLTPAGFERILVDAPCSASGVIRRHPDVKLLRRAADIPGFAAAQLAILDGLWPLLKAGGTLLYATCSVLRQENADVVEQFTAATADARAIPLDCTAGEPAGPGRQILPAAGKGDGLFYAMLSRTG